jgi:hypothetical protein
MPIEAAHKKLAKPTEYTVPKIFWLLWLRYSMIFLTFKVNARV